MLYGFVSFKEVLSIRKPKLLFISNELLSSEQTGLLRVPLVFVSVAHVRAKLYRHFRNQGTFALCGGAEWGNRVVYGAIYAIEEFDFHIRQLDSYHQCSRSLLGENSSYDLHHRYVARVTAITFNTTDELERLQYQEKTTLDVYAYFGNRDHPRIKQRLTKSNNYRIMDGIDDNLGKLIREVII